MVQCLIGQPLNIKTAVKRPILQLGLPNFRWSFFFILLLVASLLFRRIFMTSHMTLSSASYFSIFNLYLLPDILSQYCTVQWGNCTMLKIWIDVKFQILDTFQIMIIDVIIFMFQFISIRFNCTHILFNFQLINFIEYLKNGIKGRIQSGGFLSYFHSSFSPFQPLRGTH